MKIASLVPYKIMPPQKGGEKAIYYFLKHLSKYAQITCYTVTENATLDIENVEVVPVLGSTKNKFRYCNPSLFFTIKKSLAEKNISHLIIEHPYFGWLGHCLKRFAGIQLIVRSHNIEALRFKSTGKWWWKFLYYYEGQIHRYADNNFFITEEDRQFAIDKYTLKPATCHVITYGIEAETAPTINKKIISKAKICKELKLHESTTLILFNGTLDYLPNKDALDRILNQINPILLKDSNKPYKIIICGKGLPAEYDSLKSYSHQNIIYQGFVHDIELYFNAADIFINPVTDGGGIKTKLVEALAANAVCISYKSGAIGVPVSVTGNHLKIITDDDHISFAQAIIENIGLAKEDIPASFFEHFNWDKIAKKAIGIMKEM